MRREKTDYHERIVFIQGKGGGRGGAKSCVFYKTGNRTQRSEEVR